MSTVEEISGVERRRGSSRPPGAAPRRREARRASERVGAAQRLRIMTAMAALVADHGANHTTVTDVVGLAGVSRKTFYEIFEDRADCLLAAIDHALALASERATAGYSTGERWGDAVRGGLTALLQFFDEEPHLAWLCVVQSAAAGPAAFARRDRLLGEMAKLVDEGRILARRQPPPLTAEGVVGGALSVITTRLVSPGGRELIDLVNPLMSMLVLPYRGDAVARKELSRPVSANPSLGRLAASDALERLPIRLTHRTMAVLAAICAEPGLSNFQVSERAGVADQGQISKLLARLSRLGLAENTGGGQPRGAANEWHLTVRGREVHDAVGQALLGMTQSGPATSSMIPASAPA